MNDLLKSALFGTEPQDIVSRALLGDDDKQEDLERRVEQFEQAVERYRRATGAGIAVSQGPAGMSLHVDE